MAKLSRKRVEDVARWAIVIHIVAAVTTTLLWRWNRSISCSLLAPLVFWGALFWLLSLLHQRQQRMAEMEEADWQRLMAERKSGGGQGKLFEVEEGEAFLMRNRLRTLERIWLPIGSLLIVLILGGVSAVNILLLHLVPLPEIKQDVAVLSAVFLVVQAFILFLMGMYAGGMAKEPVWRHIRAGASYMMFSSAATALVILALILGWLGFHRVDLILAYVLAGALGLVAFEVLSNFVMNIYRPRLPNVEVRYAYDSRLLELITSPGGILRTAASTLDYQFGFKVSDTWFYRFLERAIAPILLFQIVAFYLLTTIVIVGPQERVVIERFGKPSDGGRMVGPGLHLKWPWPFEAVNRCEAEQIKWVVVGYQEGSDQPRLWTVSHFAGESNFLVATAKESAAAVTLGEVSREAPPPVNLLACNLAVQYRVRFFPEDKKKSDEALYSYLYRVNNPDKLLETLAWRETIRYMASVDFFKVMCTDRAQAGQELKERIQHAADSAVDGQGLGVEILFAGLEGVHPPVAEDVGKAFEEVIAAQESKHTTILSAEAGAIQDVTNALHGAKSMVAQALAYRYERGVISQAEAQQFAKQLAAYNAAPGVYEVRAFLDELERDDWLNKVRKYVVAATGWDTSVIRLNLEEAQRSSLLDLESYGKPPGTEKESETK